MILKTKNQKIGINQKPLSTQMQNNLKTGMKKTMASGKLLQFQTQIIKANGGQKKLITLILRVINFFWPPFAFIIWVWNCRSFPLAIVFFIPVFRLFCIWVDNGFWLIPIFWFFVFRIIDHLFVNPVFW